MLFDAAYKGLAFAFDFLFGQIRVPKRWFYLILNEGFYMMSGDGFYFLIQVFIMRLDDTD